MSWLGRLFGIGQVNMRDAPPDEPWRPGDDLDAKYEAMSNEPESATGGPTLAGRLKYLEQVARHGQ